MTIGCKTLSKHLTDTYYRGSAGGAAINQNSCGRRRLLMEPWKADSIPCSSLFLQIKTQGNQERNPIWFSSPPRRGSCNLLVLGGGSLGWGWQVEKIWGYCLGWNFWATDEGSPEAEASYHRACREHIGEPRVTHGPGLFVLSTDGTLLGALWQSFCPAGASTFGFSVVPMSLACRSRFTGLHSCS